MPREAKPFRATAGPTAAVTIRAEQNGDGSPKLQTFAGNAYTGAAMQPQGWWGKIICDLDGIQIPSQHRPVLRQHDHEQIVGHTTAVKIDGDGVQIEGVFSGQVEHVSKVTEPAKNGFQWQLSIGADPIRTEFLESGETTTVNGREVTGPITISRETRLGEISFVPLGADGDTSAVVSATRGKATMFKTMLATLRKTGHVKAAKYSDEEIDKMSEEDAKANFKKCMAEDDEVAKEEAKAKAKAAKAEEEKKAEAEEEEKAEAEEEKKAEASANRRIQAARKAEADELRRINEIKARCQRFAANRVKLDDGREVDLIQHAIEAGWTADHTELIARRADRPGAGVGGPHLHFGTTPIVNGAVLEAAVFDALSNNFKLFDKDFYEHGPDGRRRVSASVERRTMAELNARYTDQVRQAAHTHFRGRIGLQQLLTTLAAANGYRGPATFNDPDGWGEVAAYLGNGIRADGPSTINTPATLSNVQNKFVLQGYMFTEQSWQEFCQVLPVKDLKPTKSVQLFGDFQFKELNPAGEMQHGTIGDNPYANQAALQARMITLPMTYIINDDLNMFGQVPMMLGRGWGLRINDLVYTKLLAPGYDEGGVTNFFAATHTIAGQNGNSNLSSGAGSALSSAGLQAAKQLFDKQVDPAGQPLGVDAEILLYPPELDVAAIELMNAQYIVMAGLASTAAASKQPNTNIWKGRFKPVMSRYLSNASYSGSSTTAHYLFANPSVCPVIQLAALNGQVTPTIQTAGQDWQFNMLGISMRGWGGIGVSMQNFRGAVKSAGA